MNRPTPHPRSDSVRELDLRDFRAVLLHRYRLFLGVIVATLLGVAVVTLAITPVYESEATIQVRSDPNRSLGSGLLSGLEDVIPTGLSLPGLSDADVQTQMDVLGSRRVIERIADSLAIHLELQRPWHGFRTEYLEVIRGGGEGTPRGAYTLKWDGDGYTLSARGMRDEVDLPTRVTIGVPFQIGAMELVVPAGLASDPPPTLRFRIKPFRRAIDDLRKKLRIGRANAGSKLIEISYRHPDPHIARGLVNGIVDDFMVYSLATGRGDSRREGDILREEVARYARELRVSEDALQRFQEVNRIVAPEEQATLEVKRVAELRIVHDALLVERAALEETLRTLDSRGLERGGPTPFRDIASFPTFLANEAVQEFLVALIDLENRRSEVAALRTERNDDVVVLDARIREIEMQMYDLVVEYLAGIDTQVASLENALAGFGEELGQIPAVELEYARKVRDRELLSRVYLLLQARLAEVEVREAVEEPLLRVVDTGVIPDRAAFPRPKISLALGGILGLMLGLFSVVVAETTHPVVRTRRDVVAAGAVPVLGALGNLDRRRRPAGRGGVLVRSSPGDPRAEKVRGLALTLRASDPPLEALVVAGVGDGPEAAWLAANLGAALAEMGLRVGLLDADLRAGRLARVVGLPAEPGWNEAVVNGREILEIAQRCDGGEEFLAAGPVGSHTLTILAAEGARTLFREARARYDILLIHAPSFAEGPDVEAVAHLADAVLLCVTSGEVARQDLAEAMTRVARSGGRVIGAVLFGDR